MSLENAGIIICNASNTLLLLAIKVKKRTVHESRCSNFISRLSIVLNDKLNNDEKMKKVKSSYLKDQVIFIKDKITLSIKLMKVSLTNHSRK